MSGPVRHRRPWRRVLTRALQAGAVLVVTAALAAALQVREVRVSGTRRFPARDVEAVLRAALGRPTVATRAGALRASVLAVPWVADASVQVSLDGVVTCSVTEREPAAVLQDAGVRRFVDREGRILGPAPDGGSWLELDGFAPFPDESAVLLAAVPVLERAWGARLERVERVGPSDVALHFAGTALPVLADPTKPAGLAAARRVLTAWTATRPAPVRLDARVSGLVAVLPAPPDPEEAK
ncbi:MAG TPA: FtsQ-type POTRA domain-containing protein [Thermoanaerobaculaceae bacterium]|nr:FtsQ-type POTRA domain-containing protein [Thermoanaerobaculaceae bacterium]HQU33014.1 FtsQ-type POTRA domain-containing protein [Thermoanaerobaculaceae bacterium]